ncbi:tyrosine-type recombinase/integrase [Streptomyces sp. WZ-12]|uniref:tyrosine-type recombinase/integrase n=1 Tax=Streptomyces sp. WZ-12 TaxID=3030210 RepID=UPI002381736B|nr:tyrosine-type recombinase/integrase [Streptomyces sp. WZ-12]
MPDQIPTLVETTRNVRDRFLVSLGAVTGMRIGEPLGLHRQDMHLLSDSRVLGCPAAGPHVHARRRRDNTNGALAKARVPRAIPVTTDVVGLYADYTYERARLLPQDDQELVFVNLLRCLEVSGQASNRIAWNRERGTSSGTEKVLPGVP